MAMQTSAAAISRTELKRHAVNNNSPVFTQWLCGRLWGELSERYKDELQGDTSPAEAASLAVRQRPSLCMQRRLVPSLFMHACSTAC